MFDYPLYSVGKLDIHDRTTIRDRVGGYGPIANASTEIIPTLVTTVGSRSHVGDVISIPRVFVRSGATVHGSIRSGNRIDLQDTSVSAPWVYPDQTGIALRDLSCVSVDFPAIGRPELEVTGRVESLEQNVEYARVRVNSAGGLRLTTGHYYFTELQLEPETHVDLDTTHGPIYMHVRSGLIMRGRFVDLDSSVEADLFLGYFGTSQVDINPGFNGTFVAPHATANINTSSTVGYAGAVLAQEVILHQNTTFRHRPFPGSWPGSCEALPPQGSCGNGQLEPGEECDDGNLDARDGCNPTCQNEAGWCGNGVVNAGEDCDDGNGLSGDGCSGFCLSEGAPACGNGVREPGEQCDDGNTTSGDGC
ncbi:MAG: DUF4215 domain-containing protein, partial [Polyangiaceae bacterium]|nr:DUF4215 domain-containing protein [Polyangiaceae bacterium]